eukprot:SAG11_NODE_7234_length_1174_cov_1.808372_1_plen_47_part_10
MVIKPPRKQAEIPLIFRISKFCATASALPWEGFLYENLYRAILYDFF